MMLFSGVFILLTILNTLPLISCAPYIFDDDEDSFDYELRKKHKNRRKPCPKNEGTARTFFPFNFAYTNVNNFYNCGGNSGSHGIVQADEVIGTNMPGHHKPHGSKPHHQHNRPQINKPDGVDTEHDPVDLDTYSMHQQHRPLRPFQVFVQNHSQGMGILHTIVNGIFGNGGTGETPSVPTTVIPVHEVQEDILPDRQPEWKPGQFTTSYNPLTGQHIQGVSNFNSKQLYRRVSSGIDSFLKPIIDFF